jgi:hypothetical protein
MSTVNFGYQITEPKSNAKLWIRATPLVRLGGRCAKPRHDGSDRRPRKNAKAVREPRPTKLGPLTNHVSRLTLPLLP